MAKRINTTPIKIGIVAIILLILVLLAIAPILSKRVKTSTPKEPKIAFAPAEYAFPEYFKEQALKSGATWMINENNNILLAKGTSKYHISDTGTVYQETSDGSLILVEDQEIINEVLKEAKEAIESSDTAATFFSNAEIDTLIKDVITTDELATLNLTRDEVNALIKAGLDAQAIRDLTGQGYSIDEILAALNEGINANDISSHIDYLKDLEERLTKTLSGTGLTLDELNRLLEEAGMTPEMYLSGIENIAATNNAETPILSSTVSASSSAPITINLNGDTGAAARKEEAYLATNNGLDINSLTSALNSKINQETKTTYDLQNNQSAKVDFMNSYSENSGITQLTTNDLSAGTIITMVLKTGLNSDLPGMIVAEVSQNVYDSLTGKTLLIPKGTRMIASYNSSVSWGQKRAIIAWTQMIRPDGMVLNLPGLPGIDSAGYSGYMDKVNNHIGSLIGSAFLASILDLTANEVTQQAQYAENENIAAATGSFTNNLESAGQEYLRKQMNIQPTLTIRPGRTVKLLVTQTITLKPYINM